MIGRLRDSREERIKKWFESMDIPDDFEDRVTKLKSYLGNCNRLNSATARASMELVAGYKDEELFGWLGAFPARMDEPSFWTAIYSQYLTRLKTVADGGFRGKKD